MVVEWLASDWQERCRRVIGTMVVEWLARDWRERYIEREREREREKD